MTELDRIRRLPAPYRGGGLRRGACRRAHGTALLTPSLPLVWQLNAIRVEDPKAEAAALMQPRPSEIQGDLAHRKLVVHDRELGARLAPALGGTAGTSSGCW